MALQTQTAFAGSKTKIMLIEYTKFYYQALSTEKKKIYKELYEGFKNRKKIIEIRTDKKDISPKDLSDIAVSVYNDTPSFYYLDMTQYSCAITPFGYLYSQNYVYTDAKIKEFDRRLEVALNAFRTKYIKPHMTEYHKEKIIHDYLVKNVVYDYEAINASRHVYEAFNVLGPLLKKQAVCWGIACAFKLLCDYCQVKSFVVTGNTIPRQENTGHAWNIVKIDNETYHVDVTWDIKVKGDISFCYDYFNLDDKLISLDHAWESTLYPKCTSIKENFYYRNHLYVKSIKELMTYIMNCLQRDEHYIVVKFANDIPSKEKIAFAVSEAFSRTSKQALYKYYISTTTHNVYIELI